MVKIKSMDATIRSWVIGSLMAFLKGEKNLNWIIGIIRGGKYGRANRDTLRKIFHDLRNYGNKSRFFLVQQKCREENLI